MTKNELPGETSSDGYSHRAIWAIALPMMLSAVSVPLVGMVDTAVMGHLDSPVFLAAVALNTTLFSVLLMGLNFLRMGTTGVTAQAYGADSTERMSESLAQPALIAIVLTALILLGQTPILQLSLWVLSPPTETALVAEKYFAIRIWATPAVLLNFVLVGWLLGMQDARGPLIVILVINLTNAVLDVIFVVGLGWDVAGVAAATLIAEVAGMCTGLSLVLTKLKRRGFNWNISHYTSLARYKALFQINRDLFIRSLALMFTLAFITAQGARMGDLYLATNALLMNFLLFASYALDGIAHAAEALAGKAVGARSREGLRTAVRRTLVWTMFFAAVFSFTYLLAGNLLIDMLTSIPELKISARTYMPWLVVLPLLAAPCFLYDGVYVGATRSREMRLVMVGSAVFVFLPIWFLFRELDNHALWLALNMFMLSRSLSMHIWYKRLQARNRLIPA